jgi:hypothetical protein
MFIIISRGDHFRFGSVFIKKKVTKLIFFKKTKTKPKPVQTNRFQFGFLGQNRFRPVWLIFFPIFSVRFRFGFSSFRLINRIEPVGFFKILIGFFLRFGFFYYFFSSFLNLIGFSVFLLTTNYKTFHGYLNIG